MTLKAQPIPAVPEETARVAKAAFPKGNAWVRLRDALGTVFEDESFASLFPGCGQPGEAPWRLALVSVMQYSEGLSDRQACDAVRSRIDWKYALSLGLEDAGFDASVLCEFRSRLLAGQAEQLLLDTVLRVCCERKLLAERGKQRTDSTYVLASVRVLNRLENIAATMRHLLDVLAEVAPDWLRGHIQPEWIERYGARLDEYRLPKGQEQRIKLAETIGRDGHHVLDAIYTDAASKWLRQVPAVETLRQVWVQQYYKTTKGLRWRIAQEHGLPPSSTRIHSPHDVEARYSDKRSASWIGYKVHLTESCEPGQPHLITQVETTEATVPDSQMVDQLHRDLAAKQLLPKQHLVDAGYVTADLLVRSAKEFGVELCGPPLQDSSWQARAGQGYAASDFSFDWDKQQATCPTGRCSSSWQQTTDRAGRPQIKIKFSVLDCRPCPQRSACTRTDRRILTVHARDRFLALEQARIREKTPESIKLYNQRAGIEGTLSQAVRRSGLRRARYVGLAKTHLQNILTAAAINLSRVLNWLAEVPLAQTRRSHFAKFMLIKPVPC
jgi:transposase